MRPPLLRYTVYPSQILHGDPDQFAKHFELPVILTRKDIPKLKELSDAEAARGDPYNVYHSIIHLITEYESIKVFAE